MINNNDENNLTLGLLESEREWRRFMIDEIKELNIQSKIGYKLLTYIREGVSLLIAVNIFILPVILYHFHKLSCLSFIYNLLHDYRSCLYLFILYRYMNLIIFSKFCMMETTIEFM